MRPIISFLCFVFSGFLLVSPPLAAQRDFSAPGTQNFVRGQLYSDETRHFGDMRVELRSLGGPEIHTATPNMAGAFSMQSVQPGNYKVQVYEAGSVLHYSIRTVNKSNGEFSIRIRDTKSEQPAMGAISVERLQHKVPRKAMKALRRAFRARRSGDREKMISWLAEAVTRDPDFYDAHAHLGLALLKSGQAERSLAHFKRGMELDPNCYEPYAHFSLALYHLKSYPEAESAAREALRLSQHSTLAHYALALSLSAQDRLYEEAIASFQRASRDYFHSHLEASRFHYRRGQKHAAYTELKQYLNTNPPIHREKIERWLEQLTRESSVALAQPSSVDGEQ